MCFGAKVAGRGTRPARWFCDDDGAPAAPPRAGATQIVWSGSVCVLLKHQEQFGIPEQVGRPRRRPGRAPLRLLGVAR